ncbi:MAG: sulfotransferase family protein [Acidimicrobiales bacterium]
MGAQRSRSTLVHQALRNHPDTFLPRREIAYFEEPSYSRTDPQQFLANFAKAPPDATLGFKRPELLGRTETASRLAHAMPHARIVAVLREPIGRTVSAYFHYVHTTYLPMWSLNVGLRLLLTGADIPRYPHSQEVLTFSEYGAGLERLHQAFPREQILVVLDRDLDSDPHGSMQGILRHIGLNPDVPLSFSPQATNAGHYARGAEMRALRAASRLVYGPDRESGLLSARMGWHRLVARRVMTALAGLLPTPDRSEVATLDPDVRAALADRFAPDVRRLEELLGRQIPDWPAR